MCSLHVLPVCVSLGTCSQWGSTLPIDVNGLFPCDRLMTGNINIIKFLNFNCWGASNDALFLLHGFLFTLCVFYTSVLHLIISNHLSFPKCAFYSPPKQPILGPSLRLVLTVKRGFSLTTVFSLPYIIEHLELTIVAILCYINKTKLKWVISLTLL